MKRMFPALRSSQLCSKSIPTASVNSPLFSCLVSSSYLIVGMKRGPCLHVKSEHRVLCGKVSHLRNETWNAELVFTRTCRMLPRHAAHIRRFSTLDIFVSVWDLAGRQWWGLFWHQLLAVVSSAAAALISVIHQYFYFLIRPKIPDFFFFFRNICKT